MASSKEMKKLLLASIYRLSNGQTNTMVQTDELIKACKDIYLNVNDMYSDISYFEGKGLIIAIKASNGPFPGVKITSQGIDEIENNMISAISIEIKQFLIDRFSNEAAFDDLCREIGISYASTADFDTRITGFINKITREFPDYVQRIHAACIKLRPGFAHEIHRLFSLPPSQAPLTKGMFYNKGEDNDLRIR